MKKYRIYSMIVLFALLMSIALPSYYKKIFGKRIQYMSIEYSPIDEDFIKFTLTKDKNILYSNIDNTKTYTYEEYKQKLPFTYYYDLITNDKFPEKFIAYGQNIQAIKSEKSFLRLRTSSIAAKRVQLFPLIESKPKGSSLKYPKDLFRLSQKGISFIKSEQLKIDINKSKEYNDILLSLGATFPLKRAFGNPSLMKPFDEGYFITDAKDRLFHVKRVQNKAQINSVATNGIKFKYISNIENNRKEYYGIALDVNNNLYLLMYDNYEFVKLPIDDYDYKQDSLEMTTTPINRIITFSRIDPKTKQKVIKHYVTNLDYELVKSNEYRYSVERSKLYEQIRSILFGFELSISDVQTYYANFKINNISKIAFIISIILSLLYIIYMKLRNELSKEHIVQAILIAIGGLYSILALMLFDKLSLIKKSNI